MYSEAARSVGFTDNFEIIISYECGKTIKFSLRELAKEVPLLKPLLSNKKLFKRGRLESLGEGIIWNDDMDLAADGMLENPLAKEIKTPFDNLISFVYATKRWEMNESTLRKAVQYGKFTKGIDVMRFGNQWVITREAMEREYGPMPLVECEKENGEK